MTVSMAGLRSPMLESSRRHAADRGAMLWSCGEPTSGGLRMPDGGLARKCMDCLVYGNTSCFSERFVFNGIPVTVLAWFTAHPVAGCSRTLSSPAGADALLC